MNKEFELLEIELLERAKTLKEELKSNFLLQAQEVDSPPQVSKAIHSIMDKLNAIKITEFHPPFLPKSITKYRHQFFLPLKKEYHNKTSEKQFSKSISILNSFIVNFDVKHFDTFLQLIREPYIKKVENQNYFFDEINFKEINQKYKIRSEMQSLLNAFTDWMLEIQTTQDLLERINLYFDIKTPSLLEKIKKETIAQENNKTLAQSFNSIFRNLSSFALRKSSKFVQGSFFTTLVPATAMLTLAVVGGNKNLMWPADLDIKMMIAPTIAFAVPFLLDNMAEMVQRKEYIQKLESWAVFFQGAGRSIRKFNVEIEESILLCSSAKDLQTYEKEKLNLEKYVKAIQNNLSNLTDFDQQSFDEMRDRTEAYFRKYLQYEDGEWKVVIPAVEDEKK